MGSTISTSEFHLAVYLLTKKYKLAKLDRTNPKRVQFVFLDVPKVAIDDFWANDKIGVIDFINAQQELKKRLFSQ